jgi:hypothetical protein
MSEGKHRLRFETNNAKNRRTKILQRFQFLFLKQNLRSAEFVRFLDFDILNRPSCIFCKLGSLSFDKLLGFAVQVNIPLPSRGLLLKKVVALDRYLEIRADFEGKIAKQCSLRNLLRIDVGNEITQKGDSITTRRLEIGRG